MSNFVVTCCSTCDMSLEFMQERKIPFCMFHYTLDGKEYPDDLGQSVPFDKFYQMIADGAQPTTAQVNMEQYIEMFEPILQEGKDILHLTLSPVCPVLTILPCWRRPPCRKNIRIGKSMWWIRWALPAASVCW